MLPYSTEAANEKLGEVKKNVEIAIALALNELGGPATFKSHEFYVNEYEDSLRSVGYDADGAIQVNTDDSDGILSDYNVMEQIEILYALECRLGMH